MSICDLQNLFSDLPHRKWIHICWLSNDGTNEVWVDGIFKTKYQMSSHFAELLKLGQTNTNYSLIIGQEPDALNSDFDPHQTLRGRISEFNVWNFPINKDTLLALSNCSVVQKGNIARWNDTHMTIHGSNMKTIEYETLCEPFKKQIVIKQRMAYNSSRDYCSKLGGHLHTPVSEKDNDQMLQLLGNNSKDCKMDFWINFDTWVVSTNSDNLKNRSYSNFKKLSQDGKCGMMTSDGFWMSRTYEDCINLQACFICSFLEEPLFTVKGLCPQSLYDYVYYLDHVDSGLQFDGFKGSQIQLRDSKWTINHGQRNQDLKIKINTFDPLGRKNWTGSDLSCDVLDENTVLTLSVCDMKAHFTCNSGHCIKKAKLCNNFIDCADLSDEKNCNKIIPMFDSSTENPPNSYGQQTFVKAAVSIRQFDEINTIHSTITLTFDMEMSWIDSTIVFTNSPEFSGNPVDITGKIWHWL